MTKEAVSAIVIKECQLNITNFAHFNITRINAKRNSTLILSILSLFSSNESFVPCNELRNKKLNYLSN